MKNSGNNLVYVILGVIALSAFQQPRNNSNQSFTSPRTITVTGSADMLVPPDEISVDIHYQEFWKTSSRKSKEEIKTIEDQIIEGLTESGIQKKDIVLNSQWAWKNHWNYWYYWYDYSRYLIQKKMTVKLKNSTQLDKAIQIIKKKVSKEQSITNIQLNGSSNAKIQEYRKLVKEQAVKAAREKADYLLKAVGEKPGVVIKIRELDDPESRKTTVQSGGFYPGYYGAYGYYGGYGHSTTSSISNNAGISNSSVSMPINNNVTTTEDDMGMKPIRLRYEVEAEFMIE